MAIDLDVARERKHMIERALNPTSTEALRALAESMTIGDLVELRKLYRDRGRHVTRITSERIAVIEGAIGRKSRCV